MGGAEWQKTRAKARAAAFLVAQELVDLYRQRTVALGHAFAPDTAWQREMEDLFPYTLTADQAQAIDDVKADMERPRPMDRLVVRRRRLRQDRDRGARDLQGGPGQQAGGAAGSDDAARQPALRDAAATVSRDFP